MIGEAYQEYVSRAGNLDIVGDGLPIPGNRATERVFSVKDYGAKGDGVRLSDAAIGAGTVTLTSTAAAFTAADVGKRIVVAAAGAAGADLVTTIATRVSATQVTLAAAAVASVSAAVAVYGTDDTAAIQAAINAAYNAGGGVVYFADGVYIIAGAPVTSGTNPNAQLYLPARDFLPTTPQVPIALVGSTPPCTATGAEGGHPPLLRGAVLYSTLTGTATTYAALLGGNGGAGYVLPNFTNIQLLVRDLTFCVRYVKANSYTGPIAHGVHLGQIGSATVDRVSVFVDVPLDQTFTTTDNFVSGLIMPGNNNAAWSQGDGILVAGFPIGLSAGEHGVFGHVSLMCCRQGVYFPAANHSTRFLRLGTFWCKYGLYFAGIHCVEIGQLAAEHIGNAGRWYDTVYDIDDASNFGCGSVRYYVVTHDIGADNGGFRANGAGNLLFSPASAVAAYLESTLASAFDFKGTANDVWVDTGVSLVLPAAGTYEISGAVRYALSDDAAFAYIASRLFDVTANAAIANSETLVGEVMLAGVSYAGTVPLLPVRYIAGGPRTVKLQVKHGNGTVPLTTCELDSDAAGRTRMIARGVAA